MNPLQRNSIQGIIEDNTSLTDVLDTINLPQYLKQMITARCLLLGLKPQDTSFKHYSVLSAPYFESCASIIGGGKKIRDAFLAALRDYNIKVECNATLESLLVDGRKLKGIRLAGGKEIACKRCFFTGHPQQLESIVPPNVFRPAFLNRIKDMEETPYAFMLFGEITSNFIKNKVIYLLSENEADYGNSLDCDAPTVYISSGKPVNGRYPILAIASINQDVYAKQNVNYDLWKQSYGSKLARYIEKRIPEIGSIHILDIATPSTLKHWVYGSTGSLYGIAHTKDSLSLLPITRLDGFFMAGQNILLPGVLGAIISAAVCTGFVFGHDEILKGFRS